MDELAAAADTITGLRTFGYPPDSTPPVPSFIVSYPDTIEFDRTYGRGSDAMTVPTVLLVGRVNDRAARTNLAKYLAGAGAQSVKAALQGHAYTSCDSVHVRRVAVDVVRMGTVDYLAATFTNEIYGPGSS